MLKKTKWIIKYVLIPTILIGSVLIVFLPNIINISKYNDVISQEIEAQTGLFIKIDGQTRFSLVPKVRISIKNININLPTNIKNIVTNIGNAKDVYIEISLFDFIKRDFSQIQKIIFDGLDIDLSESDAKLSGAKDFIFNQAIDKKLKAIFYLKNSKIAFKYQNENITLQNINGKLIIDNGLFNIDGDLKYNNVKLLSSLIFQIKNKGEYFGNITIFDKSFQRDFKVNMSFSSIDNDLKYSGDFDFNKYEKTVLDLFIPQKLKQLINQFDISRNAEIKGDFAMVNGNLMVNNFIFTGENTDFKALYYYSSEKDLSKLSIDINTMKLKYDLKTAQGFLNSTLNNFKNLNIDLKAKFFYLNDDLIKDVNISLNNSNNTPKIQNLTFSDSRFKKVKFSGSLTNSGISGPIEFDTGPNFKNTTLNNFELKKVKGNINTDFETFSITDGEYLVGKYKLSGDVIVKDNQINLNLNSNFYNLDEVLKGKDIFSIFNKIDKNILDKGIILKGSIASLQYKGLNYSNTSYDIYIDSRQLSIKNLSLDDGTNKTIISGGIKNILTPESGSFSNFKIDTETNNISKFNLYYTAFPIVKDLMKGQSGTISFILDGKVSEPRLAFKGNFSDISFNLITMVKENDFSDLKINLTTKDLKKFLRIYLAKSNLSVFKNLNDNFIKENVPATMLLTLNRKENYLSTIHLTVANNLVDITYQLNNEPKLKIISNNLNLKDIVKESSFEYKSNIIIYLLQNFDIGLDVNISNIITSNDTYKNFILNLDKKNNHCNISYDFGINDKINIDANCKDNSFDGKLLLTKKIDGTFLNSKDLDIKDSYILLDSKFTSFGKTWSDLVSNLSSNFTVNFTSGTFVGFSSRQAIEASLSKISSKDYRVLGDALYKSADGESSITAGFIQGYLSNGAITNGVLKMTLGNDISLDGQFVGDIRSKMIDFNGTINISNLFDTENLEGKLTMNGYVNSGISKTMDFGYLPDKISILKVRNFYKK